MSNRSQPGSKKRKTADPVDASASDDAPQNKKTKLKPTKDKSAAQIPFNMKRMRVLTTQGSISSKYQGILYWMWRDQRVQDNWAMIYAQKIAKEHSMPLHVCFALPSKFREATIRQYGFMLKGLQEVEKELKALGIPFHMLLGDPSKMVTKFVTSECIGGVIVDFSPLKESRHWVDKVVKTMPNDVPLFEVDAHNIVPCWEASPKLEYAARTIRPKITNQLSTFLTEFPACTKHPIDVKDQKNVNWHDVYEFIKVDQTVPEVTWAEPGTKAGLKKLKSFTESHLKHFASQRNDPTKNALSNLSPWFHSGQISVQRAILSVSSQKGKWKESAEAFIEEAVIRRELADNFCFYNEHYDSVKGASDWARKTLKDHVKDKREYVYSQEQFEKGKTHDKLWNAAQLQVVQEGKMHGFLRMYWAKKILEWTNTPEEALAIAIYLNDKYQLDGNDPNGFVGCMWSICGIHDQGWAERPVFGKIRYMNYQGCKRKFDVAAFEKKYK